jgi:diguanylate cyclase (GGDEF)-like protein
LAFLGEALHQADHIDMPSNSLSACGEFSHAETENLYLEAHLSESIYLAQLCFAASSIINPVFLWSDCRFYGQPHFPFALTARISIIAVSLVCWALLAKPPSGRRLKEICLAWACVVIPASAILLNPHTSIALLVAFILPAIFYLALPVSFWGATALGVASSAIGLGVYLFTLRFSAIDYGLIAGMLLCNAVLLIVRLHSNRLSRLEWTATQSEQRMNRQLAEEHEMLHKLVKAIPVPLLITDRTGHNVLQANDAAATCFGPAFGKEEFSLERCFARDDWKKLSGKMDSQHDISQYEIVLRLPDRQPKNILLASAQVAVSGIQALLTVFVDITKRKEMEAAMRHMAHTDSLSGLPNRAFFFSVATTEIARAQRYKRPLSVFMADLDLFKQINDTHGHSVGDEVLRTFATLSKSWIRSQDFVARMGGEEFAFLLPETSESEALALAERLRASVESMRVKDLPLRVTISIGISEVRPDETTVEAALSRADRALYAAKRMGRNCVMLYSRITPKNSPLDTQHVQLNVAHS